MSGTYMIAIADSTMMRHITRMMSSRLSFALVPVEMYDESFIRYQI